MLTGPLTEPVNGIHGALKYTARVNTDIALYEPFTYVKNA